MPVDVSGENGWTALHYASMFNRTNVIKHLLHEGADVNRQNRNDKDTPLHLAARYNSTEAFRMLKDYGADVKFINNDNETPLHEVRKGSELEYLNSIEEILDESTSSYEEGIFLELR